MGLHQNRLNRNWKWGKTFAIIEASKNDDVIIIIWRQKSETVPKKDKTPPYDQLCAAWVVYFSDQNKI